MHVRPCIGVGKTGMQFEVLRSSDTCQDLNPDLCRLFWSSSEKEPNTRPPCELRLCSFGMTRAPEVGKFIGEVG